MLNTKMIAMMNDETPAAAPRKSKVKMRMVFAAKDERRDSVKLARRSKAMAKYDHQKAD